MLSNHHTEKVCHDIQMEPPVFQFVSIAHIWRSVVVREGAGWASGLNKYPCYSKINICEQGGKNIVRFLVVQVAPRNIYCILGLLCFEAIICKEQCFQSCVCIDTDIYLNAWCYTSHIYPWIFFLCCTAMFLFTQLSVLELRQAKVQLLIDEEFVVSWEFSC